MSTTSNSPDGLVEDGEQAVDSDELRFLDLDLPQAGQALAVAPGVRWCRIPLPMALDHINVWLLDHEDGCVVVDSGLNAPACEEAWHALERGVLAETPLRGVVVTHMHPDHIGLARWLQQRHDIPVWTSRRTYEQAQQLLAEGDAGRSDAVHYFATHGVRDASLGQQLAPREVTRMLSGLPEVAQHLHDTQEMSWGRRRWVCLEVHGHAEGHTCLHQPDADILICGDQVLPTISPNVGLNWRTRDKNPLGSFLASLERLSQLSTDTLVLPAHGRPFFGLQLRARDLRAHHERQLDAVEQACAEPKLAAELLPVLFRRPLSGVHIMLALAETVAHVEYLVQCGRMQRTAAAGVTRYHAQR